MAHPVDIYVGKRLRMRRTIIGMSQNALGNRIGVTFQQIQKYENGVNRIGASRLYDFSKTLGVSVSYFYEGYEEMSDNDNFGEYLEEVHDSSAMEMGYENRFTSKEAIELIKAYYRIKDKNVRRRVSELIKSISDAS